MSDRECRRRGHAWLAVGLACFFVYLDLLKSQRSSQWSGVLLHDWAGIAIGFAIYAGAGFLLLALLDRLPDRIPVGRRFPVAARGGALAATGGLIWLALSVHREFAPTLDDAIVAGALVAFAGGLVLGRWRGWWSGGEFGVLLAVFWLSGAAALLGAGEYFLFSPDRARQVTVYPAVWLGIVAVALLGTRILPAPRYVRVLSGVLGIAGPLLAVWAALHAPARPAGEHRPNLVFLVADTFRADYCSADGGPVPTPSLERLAAMGTRFERCYSLAPWTLPSMTGLFSSHYPQSLTPDAGHEVWNLEMNRYAVDETEPTFPERLAEAGYTTGAFTANAFLPSIPGMIAGYQIHASSHPILLEDEGLLRQLPFLGALAKAWCPPLANIRPHNTTIDLDHYAQAFIRRHRDRPFYLWVHYIDPHAPYDPPESLRRVKDGPWPFFHPYIGGEQWGIPILGKNFFIEEPDRDYVKSLYEGEVSYVDRFAGRIMDALDSAGVAGDTYLCFTSDHGEELWDHGEWGHGQSLHEELVRVPLLLAGPDIQVQSVPGPLSAIDLLPTLADLLAVSPSPAWRGRSLAPVLQGEAAAPTDTPIFVQGTTNKADNPYHAVIVGNDKLILRAGSNTAALYDLQADPAEGHDLAEDNPEKTEALRQLLQQWLASFPAFFNEAPVEFNRELEEGLGGMGYL